MKEILQKISECIEMGKINREAPFPVEMKGQDGVDELTQQALMEGISTQEILSQALMPGMENVGIKFRENKVFVPQVLMSAKAMSKALVHLKPYFLSGQVTQKGTFIIGTVEGDFHDIGKSLVSMMVEGNGWEVIDLGTNVKAETFIEALKKHQNAILGLSALLTTTMMSMERITKAIRAEIPDAIIVVGGAPVNQDFCDRIGANAYAADPQGLVEYLNSVVR
ncbi:corrinoid protein [Maribellus sp. YY47]|uniref:cobalamin B12-binding domain-containing protein n=1 Tax=Maribellus sp. YY47 TaxID=2929486 RepID=UPI002000A54F|nr:corrinoid protein [Maribellus sp. YY47]MCK3683676.1 corrinoid protein [Maribellus sp. YY47]